MREILVLVFSWLTLNVSLFSQTPHPKTESDLIKGRVKRIEEFVYGAKKWKPSKMIFKYDSLGRKTFEINFYIKNDPHKKSIYYNSVGDVCLEIYEANHEFHRSTYEYKYDTLGRVINLLKMHDNKFSEQYDSIEYNTDNLPIRYILIWPYAKFYFSVQYSHPENSDAERIYVEKKGMDSTVNISERMIYYNEKGVMIKRTQNTDTHKNNKKNVPSDHRQGLSQLLQDMHSLPSSHFEEYDYVDYKYDKQGNWTERKCYLNWEGKGRKLHLKEKRKIEYY